MSKPHQPSPELVEKEKAFEAVDKEWQEKWGAFYQQNEKALDELDQLREKRNIALDEVRRAAAAEAETLDIEKHPNFKVGRFSVQKKNTKWFIAEAFVAHAKELQVYDSLVQKGAILVKTEIPYKEAKTVLEDMPFKDPETGKDGTLLDQFIFCEDGKEMTPAVTSPKNIPPIGAEYKEKR